MILPVIASLDSFAAFEALFWRRKVWRIDSCTMFCVLGREGSSSWPCLVVTAESCRWSFLGSPRSTDCGRNGGSETLPRFLLIKSGFWPVSLDRKSIVWLALYSSEVKCATRDFNSSI